MLVDIQAIADTTAQKRRSRGKVVVQPCPSANSDHDLKDGQGKYKCVKCGISAWSMACANVCQPDCPTCRDDNDFSFCSTKPPLAKKTKKIQKKEVKAAIATSKCMENESPVNTTSLDIANIAEVANNTPPDKSPTLDIANVADKKEEEDDTEEIACERDCNKDGDNVEDLCEKNGDESFVIDNDAKKIETAEFSSSNDTMLTPSGEQECGNNDGGDNGMDLDSIDELDNNFIEEVVISPCIESNHDDEEAEDNQLHKDWKALVSCARTVKFYFDSRKKLRHKHTKTIFEEQLNATTKNDLIYVAKIKNLESSTVSNLVQFSAMVMTCEYNLTLWEPCCGTNVINLVDS